MRPLQWSHDRGSQLSNSASVQACPQFHGVLHSGRRTQQADAHALPWVHLAHVTHFTRVTGCLQIAQSLVPKTPHLWLRSLWPASARVCSMSGHARLRPATHPTVFLSSCSPLHVTPSPEVMFHAQLKHDLRSPRALPAARGCVAGNPAVVTLLPDTGFACLPLRSTHCREMRAGQSRRIEASGPVSPAIDTLQVDGQDDISIQLALWRLGQVSGPSPGSSHNQSRCIRRAKPQVREEAFPCAAPSHSSSSSASTATYELISAAACTLCGACVLECKICEAALMPHEAILSDPRMLSALGVVLWCKVQGASPVPAGYGAVEVFIDFAEELKRTETNQRVKFTKAISRHTNIRDQNPSLGYICPR